jgi:ABC-type phosphate transport system substrate-binding protein
MLAALVVLAGLAIAEPVSSGTAEFRVVVNASVHGTWISRAALSAIFKGKADRWGGDEASAKPVDQSASSSVRHAFTAAVLGLSMGEIQRYWQDRVARERLFPPPEKASDAEVLRYVAETAGAVGYVGPGAAIPDGVKVLSITD